ncbi:DUF4259 domain-containing protein [Streptomyces sp. NPDC048279]|uniref:DUF4259 domain-containing protein n=1 Tax=Streptomyces sp. NPDC048279 TaxID=3154714 RepID=UPI0034370365
MTYRTVKSLADTAGPEALLRAQWQYTALPRRTSLDERWSDGCTNASARTPTETCSGRRTTPLSVAAAMITAPWREEITTGTWGIGPFENDLAADFAYTLDVTVRDRREGLVRAMLARTIQTLDYLESPEGTETVAAAALIAARCPGGEPISTSYLPDEALPVVADDLRPPAVEALDRVIAEASELAELWDETPDGPKWRRNISRIRAVLAPGPAPQENPLFGL